MQVSSVYQFKLSFDAELSGRARDGVKLHVAAEPALAGMLDMTYNYRCVPAGRMLPCSRSVRGP